MIKSSTLIMGLLIALHLAVPLIWLPWTSELFEIPKMITTYVLASLIVIIFAIEIITHKTRIKIIFPLKISFSLFLAALLASTIYSVNIHTSIWGYYSRFHGGLASYLTFAILSIITATYLASHPSRKQPFIFTIIFTALIVSIYAIAQHFGIDDQLWRQDVKNRVFSTLGQPNWLASYIVAIIPLIWIYTDSAKTKSKLLAILSMNSVLYLALLYTKSRSGFLAYTISFIVFWSLRFLFLKKNSSAASSIKGLGYLIIPLIIISLIAGTPFTSTFQALKTSSQPVVESSVPQEGGTESGIIRQIVWQGAINLGLKYPILGTGPETFAYTYYWTRPEAHNLVSEWDFLYNKAHNEFLNFFATTGLVGVGSYLLLIISGLYYFWKFRHGDHQLLAFAAIASWLAISITNFFGFSVVTVNLIFFTLPALFANSPSISTKNNNLIYRSMAFIFAVGASYLIFTIAKFFYADIHYALARKLYDQSDYANSYQLISQSIKTYPNEPVYYDLGSKIAADIAVGLAQNQNNLASQFRTSAISLSDLAIQSNPVHTTFWRTRAGVFMNLAVIDPNDYQVAANALQENSILAPTDPKVPYNQAILSARLKNYPQSLTYLDKALTLKPNYYDALYARAVYRYTLSFDGNHLINQNMLQNAITDLQAYIQATHNDRLQSDLQQWQNQINSHLP